MILTTTFQQYITDVDPGFPVGGGANLQERIARLQIFLIFRKTA